MLVRKLPIKMSDIGNKEFIKLVNYSLLLQWIFNGLKLNLCMELLKLGK